MRPQISAIPDWKVNLHRVREAVAVACATAHRSPEEVQLLAVSKFQPPEAVAALISEGQLDFGENYVQEWQRKRESVAHACPEAPVQWHMTGHIQHRKAAQVAGAFALIHTLDSRRLADALEARLAPRGALQPVLLEVNVGGEQQKSGVPPEEVLALGAHVLESCPHLSLRGLMCLPPVYDAGPKARPFFAALRRLRDKLWQELHVPLPELSMGMSGDFPEAIAEGATIVRIGTSIFGRRERQP